MGGERVMITSFAEFLEQLQAKEAELLAAEAVQHAPTIGDMYEGLTRELVERAIPKKLNLRLVDGFVLGFGEVVTQYAVP